jgi:hypothetical protein
MITEQTAWRFPPSFCSVVVACHSGFLLNVFNSVIEFGAGDAAERMGKWFETGVRSSYNNHNQI